MLILLHFDLVFVYPNVRGKVSILQGFNSTPSSGKEKLVVEAMLPAFEDAVVYAKNGDWVNEVASLNAAIECAKSVAGLRGPGWYVKYRDELIAANLIFVGSEAVGDVFPESGLEVISRKNSFLAGAQVQGVAISIRTDRVICGERVHAIDEHTSASVFVDGLDEITQRPTLTRMLAFSPLPGSAILPGLALQKKTRNDLREVTFSISSADWQLTVRLSPNGIQAAKSIAERVNSIASRLERAASSFSTQPQTSISDLTKIASMLESGLISRDEFEIMKLRILGDRSN
jgi:hypothetical protein